MKHLELETLEAEARPRDVDVASEAALRGLSPESPAPLSAERRLVEARDSLRRGILLLAAADWAFRSKLAEAPRRLVCGELFLGCAAFLARWHYGRLPRLRPSLHAALFTAFTFQLVLLAYELDSSRLQAFSLSRLARESTYWVGPGESPSIHFPDGGPHDERLGYTRIPDFVDRLALRGFRVVRQARISATHRTVAEWGLFPIYREKSRAGLRVLGRRDQLLFESRHPRHVYGDFEEIPHVLVETLRFIENRELLDPERLYRNPAVEWDRSILAAAEKTLQLIHPERNVPGGSTLAVQLEKFRHSPGGMTTTVLEKLRQMGSASLRSYLDGERTLGRQREILLDYVDSVPLAAIAGLGEINGLGDGLWAWYGASFDDVNRLLRGLTPESPASHEQALAFKRALSLFIAQRRPSHFLASSATALEPLTNGYLRVLAREGVISEELRDRALPLALRPRRRAPDVVRERDFRERRAVNAIRAELVSLLGVSGLYQLDRLDATVHTTIDSRVQEEVARYLDSLRSAEAIEGTGLRGHRLLGPRDDPGDVIYSFMVYERGPRESWLRVEADNFGQPFNLNEGSLLELGSTAKLRALIHYLEVVAELHARYAGLDEKELREIRLAERDRIGRFVVEHLERRPGADLLSTLEAAMARRYSASSGERFFTGGGLHRFSNFSREHEGRILTVREAFRDSVNLVFIRLMRDVVHYHMFHDDPSRAEILDDRRDPRRAAYLARFADREGSRFLAEFYRKYRGKSRLEIMDALVAEVRPAPSRLATVFRSVRPEASERELAAFLRDRLGRELSEDEVHRFYSHSPERYSLSDRGYLARVHPLELWLAAHLYRHPDASFREVLLASPEERQESYRWLFRTRFKSAQDVRIRTMLELQAFERIHRAWKRAGYPFDSLVPSLATAIGSSGDRPSALADLMGVILNGGRRYPKVRIEALELAAGTPFETVLERESEAAERLFPPEVARVVREALVDVVERGTAVRARGLLKRSDGSPVVIGGKTGTGDNRYDVHGPNGRLVSSRSVNRTATFAFFIEDRFFGVVTVFVDGAKAGDYSFTSSLPVQVFREIAPDLLPLIEEGASPCGEAAPCFGGAASR